jgi:hypothetical protein
MIGTIVLSLNRNSQAVMRAVLRQLGFQLPTAEVVHKKFTAATHGAARKFQKQRDAKTETEPTNIATSSSKSLKKAGSGSMLFRLPQLDTQRGTDNCHYRLPIGGQVVHGER